MSTVNRGSAWTTRVPGYNPFAPSVRRVVYGAPLPLKPEARDSVTSYTSPGARDEREFMWGYN